MHPSEMQIEGDIMDNGIFVLTIEDNEEFFDMYFTTLEKATKFIFDNYGHKDKIRKVTNEYYESKLFTFTIKHWIVD